MFVALWVACTGPKPSGSDSGGTDSPPTSDTLDTTDTADTTPPTDTYTPPTTGSPFLTVDDGYGDGQYAVGAGLHVWAGVDPQTELVVGWEGEPAILETAIEWNAPGTMPDHSVTLTPTVEAVALAFEQRAYALETRTRDVLVHETPGARGAVLFFHGASYSIDEVHDNAGATIAMALVRAGWTVVAVQSEAEAASGVGGWSSTLDLGSNTDLRNVSALIDELHADGTVASGAPLVAWGMSSGGMFAHTVGGAHLVDAVVAYCAPGTSEANAATTAPTAWYLAAVDQTFPTGATDAAEFAKVLDGKGIATDLYVHPITPLYDERFERVSGVDAATSAAIADGLRASGAVDARDLWIQTGGAITSTLTVPGLSTDQLTAVKAEIEIMAADHELYDDVAGRMVGFLDANL